MSEFQGIARFKFHEGKVEEFKRLSAQAMEIVRTKDTGTLQYDRTKEDESACSTRTDLPRQGPAGPNRKMSEGPSRTVKSPA